jgi:hypothetical protein
MSQPHFGLSVRMKLTHPKVGTWSPPRLLKIQSLIAGIKTPRIGVFFISMERSRNENVQNGLAWAIWTSTTQVMGKRRAGSQTGSRESTSSRCLQKECNRELESSWGELQLWFRPHSNRRSEPGNMSSQSPGSPTRDSFGTPPWESREKMSFNVAPAE